jgi:hypothetical protein
MNKKLFVSIIAMFALVAMLATILVGCNSFAWTSVGGGEPDADVISNGGYFVKQGKYVYFINGYDTAEVIDNTFGVPVKNSIVRAELVDGEYKNFVVVVPKQVYNKDANGGFAIFGEWIYYATPNNDEDIHGHASTTHTDFMRTKIDGSATQLIATINSRTSQYLFTESRILVSNGTSINYIDFSGMKGNGSSRSKAGVKTGVLAENVESFKWDMNCDYVYFTETVTGDTSYEFCNTLNAIKIDGTEDKKVFADKLTYLNDEEKKNYTDFFSTKVFNFALVDMVVEADGATLYYTKSTYINSQKEVQGLFVNKVAFGGDFAVANEKQISKNTTISTVYGLNFADGALVTIGSNIYLANSAEGVTTDNTPVIGRAATIQTIHNGVVYYTDSTGGKVYAINLDGTNNEDVVFEAKFNTSWLNLEINAEGDNLMIAFFNSDYYNYLHVANIMSDEDSTMLGIINDADKEAIEKAEAEKK